MERRENEQDGKKGEGKEKERENTSMKERVKGGEKRVGKTEKWRKGWGR